MKKDRRFMFNWCLNRGMFYYHHTGQVISYKHNFAARNIKFKV